MRKRHLLLLKQEYEKNFKKGLLNDQTLPLLTDRRAPPADAPPAPSGGSRASAARSTRHFPPSLARPPARRCSALKEVKIPPGPRLRILHHVALARAAQANTRGGKAAAAPAGPQQVAQVALLSLALPIGC